MVYIDNFNAKFQGMIMCHMIADTQSELFEMADKVGLKREWIQDLGTTREHFDISLTKKKLAIKFGAKEINFRELATILYDKKQNKKNENIKNR